MIVRAAARDILKPAATRPVRPFVIVCFQQPLESRSVEATLKRTPLFDRHVALGARMVPFAGYEMPVQYEGVIPEHKAVRSDAGAFDVSHMGEIHVDGPSAQVFLQTILSNDIDRLADGGAQYTLLTNETGGIVDDLIVYRLAYGQFYLVVNASNRVAVYTWLKDREPHGCEVRDASDEYGLVAVQGPQALARLGLPEAFGLHARDGRARRDRGHDRANRVHGGAGCRAVLP